MILGKIKHCPNCDKENYVRTGVDACPNCGKDFGDYPMNKAPIGWIKKENYEISRDSVDAMLKDGTLSKEDLKW